MHHDSGVFAARRNRLYDAMEPRSVAIFLAGHEQVRSHDTEHPFRASSDVLYLTGFEEPDTVVVLAPGHEHGPLVMFVRPRDKEMETWTGRRAGVEGAVERFGANKAWTLDELGEKLPGLLEGATTLYHRFGVDPAFDGSLIGMMERLRRRKGKPPAAPTVWRDVRELLHPMRSVKSAEELALLRQACEISSEAHVAAMRACRPGLYEYELQALIEFVFLRRGAQSVSYNTIVGAGVNGTILHYVENRSRIAETDLVLIDAGAEYRYYAGDITRTFPASGRFTGAQRDIYQLVLEAEEAAIAMCTVGTTWKAIHEATVRRLTAGMVDLGLLSGELDGLIEKESYKRFFMHKTGHWLGSDVHDVGPYFDGESAVPIMEGMVQTIEPGIYIEPGAADVPEAFWGIGVRIEDDVLTTASGPEVLTASCPKSIAALEDLVGTGYRVEL